MIVPMLKYTFLVFHKEYQEFLKNLQELGVVHVNEKEVELSESIKIKCNQISRYENIIQFLKKRNNTGTDTETAMQAYDIIEDIFEKQKELESLQNKVEELEKDIQRTKPWGNFSTDLIQKLTEENIHFYFYLVSRKKAQELEKEQPVKIISEQGNQLLIAVVQLGEDKPDIDEEELQLPAVTYSELEKQLEKQKIAIEEINACFDEYSESALPVLEKTKAQLLNSLSFDKVIMNTDRKVENKLMILEGWVPQTKTLSLNHYLEEHNIVFVKSKGTPEEKIPVLLKNNRFSRLFEPIGSMFSLPDYAEMDLTVFFAPFFMMFFGFCLGDAGYGLLFLVGGGIYKLKADKIVKPYLSLIQLLGLATIIFGAISGTLFGINLIETKTPLTENFRHLFLNPDKMFNLSLILGGIQIIFGLFVKAANLTKQFGFSYALATCGWLIILLGSITYTLLSMAGVIPENSTILYIILAVGGFFVLFYSDPGVNVFARVGKGVWDVYSTVTGIFGDMLSYIRLFALGLSSAILGFVINDIGLQILGSSKILGPVFFVIFLLLGHTLNILISSLGSFVHPMRLTFVEFYKNAGFKGGGEEYKPFAKDER